MGTTQPLGFAAGTADPTGLVKFGGRYYDPNLGRWTQPDSMGGGYIYAGNNPVNETDPTGQFSFGKWLLHSVTKGLLAFLGSTLCYGIAFVYANGNPLAARICSVAAAFVSFVAGYIRSRQLLNAASGIPVGFLVNFVRSFLLQGPQRLIFCPIAGGIAATIF